MNRVVSLFVDMGFLNRDEQLITLTGAIEMGDLFESAEIIGVDLSAIQPTW